MHGCPCQNQTYYDGSPPKNSVPIFLISPCCSGLFLRGHCLSQERSYTKSCSTTTPKPLTASSQDIPPSVGFVPSVSWWHNSHTPAEQRRCWKPQPQSDSTDSLRTACQNPCCSWTHLPNLLQIKKKTRRRLPWHWLRPSDSAHKLMASQKTRPSSQSTLNLL